MPSDDVMTVTHGIVLFAAAMLAGAINAVAGGGTLVTFPALLWSGLEARLANATSTVALWPGSIGGMWGYRRELRGARRWIVLLVPSVIGGAAGARLLLATPADTFRFIVPYMILGATFLFMLQGPIGRIVAGRVLRRPGPNRLAAASGSGHEVEIGRVAAPPEVQPVGMIIVVVVLQAAIATYGGYFGAGIGILMLSALSLLQIESIHEMNGLKTLLATCINGMAAGYFIWAGAADWPRASVMIAGSIAGGYGGASVARQLGQTTVRTVVIVIGFCIAGIMFYRQLSNI